MNEPKHKGGRPLGASSAVSAWKRYRPQPGTGELSRMAKALGVPQSSLNIWRKVPEARLDAAAEYLGVAESDLRPDLFPASSPWDELLS